VAAGALALQAALPAAGRDAELLLATRAAIRVAWPGFLLLHLIRAALDRPWRDWRGSRPACRAAGAQPHAAVLGLGAIVRRAALVAAVPLPRYLADPVGGAVASLWIIAGLTCAYAYVEPFLGRRWRSGFWIAAAIFLVPWTLAGGPRWPEGALN
jgi:hypothetical protein